MQHSIKIGALAALIAGASAQAAFVGYVVVSTNVTSGGLNLTRHEVFARFNGATDTALNVFSLRTAGSTTLSANDAGGFWHKDNSDYNGGVLSQQYGTWAPQLTGGATTNRPFDSFVLIGGNPLGTNTTNADPSWGAGAGWNQAQLPIFNPSDLGWFNSNPPNLQGRVGVAPNTATDVKLAQFMLSSGHAERTYSLTVGYNNGVAGSTVSFGNGTFTLVPTPGALAVLGLGGLRGRRRR
jgi:hypothetical protein